MLELIRVSCLLSHETTCASGMSLFLAFLALALNFAFALLLPLNYRLSRMCPLCHLCAHF